MATYKNLTFGHGFDDVLNQMLDECPDIDFNEPEGVVAALIWLDNKFGLNHEGDYVLVHPSLSGWFLAGLSSADPVVADILRLMNSEEEIGDEDAAALARLEGAPFEVEFTSSYGPEATAAYPAYLRGKQVLLRNMNAVEAEKLGFARTVRADGSFIKLPKPGSYSSVAEVNASGSA